LVEVLGYLIHMLLLAELAKDKLGILVSLGLLVLFLQCQELVRRLLLVRVALVGLVVLGMVQLVLIILATILLLLFVLSWFPIKMILLCVGVRLLQMERVLDLLQCLIRGSVLR
jgi:hypothetical protein